VSGGDWGARDTRPTLDSADAGDRGESSTIGWVVWVGEMKGFWRKGRIDILNVGTRKTKFIIMHFIIKMPVILKSAHRQILSASRSLVIIAVVI